MASCPTVRLPISRVLPLLSLVLASAAFAQRSVPPKTLWLVQPLYPGQELLVGRTETAIAEIMPADQRANELIGRKELQAALAGKKPSLSCITGETACANPLDAVVAELGFDRIVLIRGGQDESGYRFRVTSYRPSASEVNHAEGSNAKLEKALLGALVKVVPLASTMELNSTPPGATVFIDGEKLGVTPLSTQVLPGERVIKLELPSHLPQEVTENIPVRGTVKVEKTLEKVPARLTVIARPEGAQITIDGMPAGKDKVDQGIAPGPHTVAIALEGYLPYEQQLDIAPGDSATVDRALTPTTMTGVKAVMHSAQEEIYGRRAYFQLAYETAVFNRRQLSTNIERSGQTREVTGFPAGDLPRLNGLTVEYGNTGRYFGLAVIGATYVQGARRQIITTDDLSVSEPAMIQALTLRGLQPQLRFALWRFAFGVQAGLDVRLTQVLYRDETDMFGPAARAVDLQLAAQANARFYIFDGLYLMATFRASRPILTQNAGFNAFQGGVGYAF